MVDYTNEVTVEAYMGETFDTTTTPTSAQVAIFITNASRQVDEITNQIFDELTIVDELSDFTRFEAIPQSQTGFTGSTLISNNWSIGRADVTFREFNAFKLEKKPIIAITSLEVNNGSLESPAFVTLVEDTDFIVYKDLGKIVLITNFPNFGLRKFKTSYTAGTGAGVVPATVQELTTLIVVRTILNTKISSSTFGSVDSISIEGISIRKTTGQSTSYVNSVQRDIERLTAQVGFLETELV